MAEADILLVERQAGVLIVTPETAFTGLSEPEIMAQAAEVRKELETLAAEKVLIDLSHLPYFGSKVLEWMAQIWKQVKSHHGHLVLAAPSPIAREVLAAARFDKLWPIHATREEALDNMKCVE
jgi:anti-anti-sigma factor